MHFIWDFPPSFGLHYVHTNIQIYSKSSTLPEKKSIYAIGNTGDSFIFKNHPILYSILFLFCNSFLYFSIIISSVSAFKLFTFFLSLFDFLFHLCFYLVMGQQQKKLKCFVFSLLIVAFFLLHEVAISFPFTYDYKF